ncbi:MAG: GIY-YIG nuclease family protein [Woeseiaceae bacterium]|nr:GIY-YIG nuclease family protein [Woeseiaceae bacterium]
MTVQQSCYSLYILRCADDSLYTGIAIDVQSRIQNHETLKQGAKYLRGRAPFALVFEHPVGDRSAAQRLEHQIKKLPRAQKLALIAGDIDLALLGLDQASGSAPG